MRIPFTLAALCAATATLTGAAHAQSSVTVYGILDVTVRYADNAAAGGASLKTVGDGAYTGSRLGFRGTEDLGGGLKAFFNIEQGIDPSSGTLQQATTTANYGQGLAPNGRAWGRASLVGLSTPFGTLALGRQYTLAHDMSGRFQPQSNPNQDSLSVFSGHHVSRQDNMAKYTNQFGPVGVALSATAGEGTNGKAWGVAGNYTSGPIDAVAYAQEMESFNGAETRKIYGLGGSYAVAPGLKAYLGAMQRSHDVSLQKNKVWTAGVNFNVTNELILTASYTQDKQTGANVGSRKVAFVGADYLLSKRTDLYVEIDNNKVSGAFPLPSFMGTRGSATGMSAGLRHRF
jgi:predicted porin